MALFTQALTTMGKRMVKDNSLSKMVPSTPEIGSRIQ